MLLNGLNIDPLTESRPERINLDIYIPPDEQFSPKKLSEFMSKSIQATTRFLIPELKSLLEQGPSSFESFDEIRDMFSKKRSQVIKGKVKQELKKIVSDKLFKKVTRASRKGFMELPLPQIIAGEAACNLFS